MHHRFLRSNRGLASATAGSLAVLLLLWLPQSRSSAAAADHDAPSVLVLPYKSAGERAKLRLEARVEDPSGLGDVKVWARGEKESVFRSFAMEAKGGGLYAAELPRWPEQGTRVAYFVEATDAVGNGPRRIGGEKNPYIARLAPSGPARTADPAPQTETNGHGRLLFSTAGGLLLIAGLAFLKLRSSRNTRRQQERLFWDRLLMPLADLRGAVLQQAVRDLCGRKHDHPSHGSMTLTRSQILGRLDRFRQEVSRHSETIRQVVASTEEQQASELSPEQRILEDLFWHETLSPLLEATPFELGREIDRLASFPHSHPVHGMKIFERQLLLDKLEWVRRTSVQDLRARRKMLQLQGLTKRSVHAPLADPNAAPAGKGSHLSAGFSLIEILMVLSLLGLSLGIAALYLKPMEAPLHTTAMQLDAMMRQTRALSMASTSAHRVRPVNDHQLLVERATSCSSVTWTAEPRLDLYFPHDVTLGSTAWSICFSTRGVTSQNVVITLNHPSSGSQQLEVMLGGSLRWLP